MFNKRSLIVAILLSMFAATPAFAGKFYAKMCSNIDGTVEVNSYNSSDGTYAVAYNSKNLSYKGDTERLKCGTNRCKLGLPFTNDKPKVGRNKWVKVHYECMNSIVGSYDCGWTYDIQSSEPSC